MTYTVTGAVIDTVTGAVIDTVTGAVIDTVTGAVSDTVTGAVIDTVTGAVALRRRSRRPSRGRSPPPAPILLSVAGGRIALPPQSRLRVASCVGSEAACAGSPCRRRGRVQGIFYRTMCCTMLQHISIASRCIVQHMVR